MNRPPAWLLITLVWLFLLAGCAPRPALPIPPTKASPILSTELPPNPPTPIPGSTSLRRCGDGVCDGPENAQNCPADCQPANSATAPAATVPSEIALRPGPESNTYWVTNPNSGAALYVRLSYPQGWSGDPLPTLVLVPGGIGVTEPQRADRLAQAGFTIVLFDPDGRGRSQGSEDLGGFVQQDGLAAVIRAATTLPGVDMNRIAVVSYSYGVTMATGALARHPDLPVRFLIDWEGPADRFDTTSGCKPNPRISWPDCNDDAAWAQREALTFIAQIRVPYQRVQSQSDHVQPDVSHAINMINAAIQGGVPWTRLNLEEPNQRYDPAHPPAMIPDEQDRQLDQLIARLAQELFILFGG